MGSSKMIKLKNILTEAKELDQSYITKAAAMTNRNNHSEARQALARGVKDKKLEQAYRTLEKVTMYLRRANETNVTRDALDKLLLKQLKQKFSNWKDAWGAL